MKKNLSTKNMSIAPSVTLAITAKAKKMKGDGEDVISFGAGEPDFKTPENIRRAAIKVIEEGSIGYTAASGLLELKESICEKLKKDNGLSYEPESIVVSCGAKHSLSNALQAICNPGDEVIVPLPYWVSYPELVKMADANPVFVEACEENGFKYSVDDLKAAINENTKALILNSPSNPTGAVYTNDELEEIAKIAVENNIYVISDEIYEKLIYEGKHISIASLGERIKELTIVVNGVSKCYAMTGWRIGYTAANREITRVMENIQSHATSNPNTIAQYASIEALNGDQSILKDMKKAFDERRNFMADRINSIDGVSCTKPAGAFYVMMNIKEILGREIGGVKIENSMDFANYLLDSAKVAVVPGIGFGSEGYVRLSYATSLDNIMEGLERIEKAMDA
ncbi:aspartate aminotransferase [Peptoclostridium litorale DSM 5388]|uniref:Aminotransferase n=1 Tax=Peptoclostridium litorale DSM 5388 TaxID=1121324 RepID=A0A069RFI6_PEPLI|nr:pyridoxal phosphate-dependent aminotransferase [Peptoclostridium litorale]KDR95776.1 aspartate aminotransferase [Peptoclostridium litorale DSM 5388]SIO21553.1 aspartate aminotransferase [Peptoclostridium litorale DSM 5388]